MDERNFQVLLDQIYAITFDDAALDPMLQALRTEFDASAVITQSWNQPRATPWLQASTCGDEAAHRFNEYYHRLATWNHFVRYTGGALRQPLVLTDDKVFPRDIYLSSEIHNDFHRPIDIGRSLIAVGDARENQCTITNIMRTAHAPEFDRREIKLLTRLAPHLSRAVCLYHEMSPLRAEAGLYRDALETLGLAAFMLEETGRVIELNGAAKTLLDRPEGVRALSFHKGQLRARDTAGQAALMRALNPNDGYSAPAGFRLNGPSPAAALKLSITRLPDIPAIHGLHRGSRIRFLVTAAPLHAPIPPVEQIRESFDMTQAEAEITRLLAQGMTPAQIAGLRGTSPLTIKTQIKHIYAKTGVSGHAALIARLLGGFPWSD